MLHDDIPYNLNPGLRQVGQEGYQAIAKVLGGLAGKLRWQMVNLSIGVPGFSAGCGSQGVGVQGLNFLRVG